MWHVLAIEYSLITTSCSFRYTKAACVVVFLLIGICVQTRNAKKDLWFLGQHNPKKMTKLFYTAKQYQTKISLLSWTRNSNGNNLIGFSSKGGCTANIKIHRRKIKIKIPLSRRQELPALHNQMALVHLQIMCFPAWWGEASKYAIDVKRAGAWNCTLARVDYDA